MHIAVRPYRFKQNCPERNEQSGNNDSRIGPEASAAKGTTEIPIGDAEDCCEHAIADHVQRVGNQKAWLAPKRTPDIEEDIRRKDNKAVDGGQRRNGPHLPWNLG